MPRLRAGLALWPCSPAEFLGFTLPRTEPMTRLGGRIFAKLRAPACCCPLCCGPTPSQSPFGLVGSTLSGRPLPNSFVGVLAGRFAPYLEESSSRSSLDFDASLGFPGEGPYIDFCHRVSAWWPFLLFDFSWLGPGPASALLTAAPSDCSFWSFPFRVDLRNHVVKLRPSVSILAFSEALLMSWSPRMLPRTSIPLLASLARVGFPSGVLGILGCLGFLVALFAS